MKTSTYSGIIFLTEVGDGTLVKPVIKVDGNDINNLRFDNLFATGCIGNSKNFLSMERYNTEDGLFTCALTQHITFETSLSVRIWNASGALESIYCEFVYAVTP